MDKKINNPEVRFKGFTEDWEEQLLGTICNIVGGGTPSTIIPEYWGGDIDWYSPTEIGKEIYALGSIKKITKLGFENCSAKILPPEKTILFTSRAGIGDMAILKREGSTNQGFQSFILNKDINTYFIYSAGPLIKKFSLKNASGSTFLEISGKTLEKMVIHLPKPTEQKQIGTFFQNLDNLITLHQKKYDKLVILKKAMLVKMFPEKGALVPEIRFKGFRREWEEKEMKEVTSNISDGNWIESNHIFEKGEYRIIQTGNLGLGHFIDKSNNAKYFNQKDFDEVRGNEIFPGDILISRLAEPAGRTIILPSTGFRMVTAVDVTIIRPDSNSFDSTFIMTQLNSSDILNIVNQNVSGTSHRRISRRNLEKTILRVPTLIEQQKIGSYFKNVDNQLSMHRKQLEKLNNIKKACFTKMFVAQD